MPNTLAQVEAFPKAHPRPHQGGTWNQKCEQFINNSGGFSEAFSTAILAAKASGKLDPNPATARNGEIHYWSGMGDGHDAWQTSRGLLCASNAIPGYLGYISFAAFKKAKPGFAYMGHTFRHGTQTLAGLSLAGTGTITPLGGFLMALSDAQQQAVYDAIFVGGTSMPDGGQSIGVSLAQQHQNQATIIDLIKKIAAPTVDPAAVAASLASNTGFLGALAKAVNDDAARRLAS